MIDYVCHKLYIVFIFLRSVTPLFLGILSSMLQNLRSGSAKRMDILVLLLYISFDVL